MVSRELSAGDKIDARCSKCGNTKHIILAISGQTPNRVKCDLCDREHNYHPPRVEKPRAARSTGAKRTPARRTQDPREAERQQWEELNLSAANDDLTPYAMDSRFKPAMRISHPTFGIGVVVGLPGPKKVEVLFKDGKKVLRCA